MDGVEKVYTQEVIEDMPFPQAEQAYYDVSQAVSGRGDSKEYGQEKVRNTALPRKRIATELLSQALNTKSRRIVQEFQFNKQGALQIGEYEDGVRGDVRITEAGITARNKAGNTTFGLDGETGDATFAGTIQAGALIAGLIAVGNDSWVIDGDPDTPQILLYNDGIAEILIGEDGT